MRLLLSLSLLLSFGLAVGAQQKMTAAKNERLVVFTGVVYDQMGAVIPGTRVAARRKDEKLFRTTANENGVFELRLVPSTYEIEFDGPPGFKKLTLNNAIVVDGYAGKMNHDIVLEVRDCDDCGPIVAEPLKDDKKP
jgi:hypothetical protein